ncbi:hypothetical protein [Dysgonomonas sp. 25]|uniref:hypothetical protein n=1 Tax=Dysgonomonas sp. 25 TaxID=2302933 RepID=UPI0013D7383A|nr:hypothetical protein [Dysgonomonas sp. 25]
MKSINKIYAILLVLCISIGFAACSEEEASYKAPKIPTDSQVAYFASPFPTEPLILSTTSPSINIQISRINSTEAITVPLVSSDTSGIFNIPEAVSFTAGSNVATITITYNPADIIYGVYNQVSISIDDDYAFAYAQNGYTEYLFEAGIMWLPLGMATYTEDFLTSLYGAPIVSYQIPIEENVAKPGLYRLVYPYGAAYPYNDPGDWDTSKNYYMEINAVDPQGVYIELQNTGLAWREGAFYVYSLAGLRLAQGWTLDQAKSAGMCGTLSGGVITFPANKLLSQLPAYNANFFTANTNGAFKIVLP